MVKKRPSIDRSPSYSFHAAAAGEDARARMKHQALLQDYQDLIKETEATKKRILKASLKKLNLSSEVKFLKRKLKSFTGGHSLEIPLKLKKESYRVAIPSPELEQMHNSGLPSKAHLDDRSHDITEAAARGITARFNLNQVSNRPVPPSISYAHMHNSGLPPKAPLVDRKHKVTQAATLKTTTLSDSNQVSYRPVPPSSRYSHMHKSGLPRKAPRNHKVTEAATRENTGLLDLNQVSYRVAPPSARYSQMNSSGLPSKAFTVVGNYEVTKAATRGTSTLLDLNQDAENFEEQEPLRIDNPKRFSVGGSATMNDHKLMLGRVGCSELNRLPLRV